MLRPRQEPFKPRMPDRFLSLTSARAPPAAAGSFRGQLQSFWLTDVNAAVLVDFGWNGGSKSDERLEAAAFCPGKRDASGREV